MIQTSLLQWASQSLWLSLYWRIYKKKSLVKTQNHQICVGHIIKHYRQPVESLIAESSRRHFCYDPLNLVLSCSCYRRCNMGVDCIKCGRADTVVWVRTYFCNHTPLLLKPRRREIQLLLVLKVINQSIKWLNRYQKQAPPLSRPPQPFCFPQQMERSANG